MKLRALGTKWQAWWAMFFVGHLGYIAFFNPQWSNLDAFIFFTSCGVALGYIFRGWEERTNHRLAWWRGYTSAVDALWPYMLRCIAASHRQPPRDAATGGAGSARRDVPS